MVVGVCCGVHFCALGKRADPALQAYSPNLTPRANGGLAAEVTDVAYSEELILSALRYKTHWLRLRDVVKPGHFTSTDNRKVFAKIDALHRTEDVDEIPVSAFNVDLPTLPEPDRLDPLLKDFAIRVRLHDLAIGATALRNRPGLLTDADCAGLAQLTEIAAATPDIYNRIVTEQSEERQRFSTGLHFLDRALSGGLSAGELVVIGAPPHGGKTHWLVTLGTGLALNGMPVYHFVLEDLPDDVIRYYWQATRRLDREEANLVAANLTVLDYADTSLSVPTLDVGLQTLLSTTAPSQVKCCIVDYADIIDGPGSEERHRLTAVMKNLRKVGNKHNVIMLTATQLDAGAWETRYPSMRNFAESKIGKGATADVVALWSQLQEEKASGEGRLVLAKLRGRRNRTPFLRVQANWDTFEVLPIGLDTQPEGRLQNGVGSTAPGHVAELGAEQTSPILRFGSERGDDRGGDDPLDPFGAGGTPGFPLGAVR